MQPRRAAIIVGGKHHYLRRSPFLEAVVLLLPTPEFGQHLKPVHVGHFDVEHHQLVWMQLAMRPLE